MKRVSVWTKVLRVEVSQKVINVHRVGAMILNKMPIEKTDVLWDAGVTLVAISFSEERLCEQFIESL